MHGGAITWGLHDEMIIVREWHWWGEIKEVVYRFIMLMVSGGTQEVEYIFDGLIVDLGWFNCVYSLNLMMANDMSG